MKRWLPLLLLLLTPLTTMAAPAHPLAGKRLIMDGASCAGLEFLGGDAVRMYDEMECSRGGDATLEARVRTLAPNLLMLVEQVAPGVVPDGPPRTWIYRIDSVTASTAVLAELWTGWGELPDERLSYRVVGGGGEGVADAVRIEAMVAGDIACYVTITDPRGERRDEMADFEICEREGALVGQRVRLRYETAQVAAYSCQGDPECTDYRQVQLIVAAEPLR